MKLFIQCNSTLFSAVVMYAAVVSISSPNDVSIVALVSQAVMGAAIYFAATGVIWLLSGKPDGAEAIIYEFVKSKLWGNKTKELDPR